MKQTLTYAGFSCEAQVGFPALHNFSKQVSAPPPQIMKVFQMLEI